jgi:hypothetical protein
MQEVSMQVLTIAMAMNIVSYIDRWPEKFRGSSARHEMVSELHSGTPNFKLTNSAHGEPFTQARMQSSGARLLRSHDRPRSQALCVSKPASPKMNRKRRTVLWLYTEDYDYLSAVAEQDMDSKNVSMHRLVKALRTAGVKSFLRLDETLKRLPPPQGRA